MTQNDSKANAAASQEMEGGVGLQRVDWLFRSQRAGVIGHVLGALFTAGFLSSVVDTHKVAVWLLLCASTAIPGWLAYDAYQRRDVTVDPAYWGRMYAITAGIGGASWGLSAILLYPHGEPAYLAMLTLVLLAACAVSVASDAVYFPAVAAFVIPCLSPLVIRLLLESNPLYAWWSAGLLFVAGVMMFAAKNLERLFLTALTQKRDAETARLLATRADRDKTRFLASASHDLRQPLTSLTINASMLAEHVHDGQGRKIHDHVVAAIDDLNHVLNVLLDVSKLDADLIEPRIAATALQPLLDSLQHAFEAEASAKGLRLRVRRTALAVYTDPELLKRMLANLVSNALRYTVRGGLLIACRKRAGHLRIEVWDTGIGIPQDQWENVFGEFQQLDNPQRDRAKGLGLGLSITRRIGKLLAHRVELRSQPGRGSRFSVIAQLAPLPQSAPGLAAAMSGAYDPLIGATIGLIENEARIREDVAALLRRWGCRVLHGESSASLESACARAGQDLDAVISDFRLGPDENGIDAITQLRKRFPALPALIITGDTSLDTLRDAQRNAVAVVAKPFDVEKLRYALRVALTSGPGDANSALS